MENYIHDIPTKVYFGKGMISHLDESLRQFGKNVLLAYGGGSIKKTGLYDEVMKILNEGGFTVTELSGIEPNPRIESVERGVQLCKENNIDVVLAVGGGSVIDCAKAVCSGFYYEGDDLWYMVKYVKGTKKSL
ncbi:MAG: iron-containing alcohol dehydrogenase, partial [Erysipelotrichaceae bacterium]|nr:iron-containing alcohol dehydrogenase [Erysipelotrichaceae bacterium]